MSRPSAPTAGSDPGASTHTPSGASQIATLEELGLRGTLFLAALLKAHADRLALAPTHHSALLVLDTLRGMGVIQVPWPDQRWQIRPDAYVTPLEGLQWAFSWPSHDPTHLLPALEDQLMDWGTEPILEAQRMDAWQELALWETESFLEQQLRKHQFDTEWARDVAFIFPTAPSHLPIARWRYCCWAAVRQGASVALCQSAPDAAGVREAIFQEMRKRLRYMASGPPHIGMFTPFQASPSSALAQLFVEHVIPMDWAYWTQQRNRDG